MCFHHINRISSQCIDNLHILSKHIRVLVIFPRYILLDGVGEGDMARLPERQGQDRESNGIGMSF